jgi:hypothetical protein
MNEDSLEMMEAEETDQELGDASQVSLNTNSKDDGDD